MSHYTLHTRRACPLFSKDVVSEPSRDSEGPSDEFIDKFRQSTSSALIDWERLALGEARSWRDRGEILARSWRGRGEVVAGLW